MTALRLMQDYMYSLPAANIPAWHMARMWCRRIRRWRHPETNVSMKKVLETICFIQSIYPNTKEEIHAIQNSSNGYSW
jgi:hypothetical protein